ncbi:MAG TPA: hypothetical protein VIK29_07155 [Paludibacter sp.]
MKKFSDLGIKPEEQQNIFPVQQISITDVTNCEIEILDFAPDVKTQFGEGRYVVRIRYENIERKFFTNAKPIKDALDKVNKADFPFTTTIKPQKFGNGNGKTFYFT